MLFRLRWILRLENFFFPGEHILGLFSTVDKSMHLWCVRARILKKKKNRLRKLKFAFNKLVIEIAVTCYIFKIMAHERKF